MTKLVDAATTIQLIDLIRIAFFLCCWQHAAAVLRRRFARLTFGSPIVAAN
jgi:hypothetical protein